MMQIYGTREVATIEPRKHIEIVYPAAAREALLGVPVALTDAYPADPHVVYTVEAGDLPTVSGVGNNYAYTGILYIGGHNLDDPGTITITPLVHKNGGDISTGFGYNITGGACWTMNIYLFGTLIEGDVLEVWLKVSIGENADVDYSAFAALAIRPFAGAEGQVILNAQYQASTQYPTLALADPSVQNYVSATINIVATNVHVDNGPPFPAVAFGFGDDRALYRFQLADASIDLVVFTGANRPLYDAFYPPTDITFYPTSIRVV